LQKFAQNKYITPPLIPPAFYASSIVYFATPPGGALSFRREESLFAVSERGRKDAPRTGNLRVGFFAGFCRRTELIVAKKARSQKFNPPAILIANAKANTGCPEIFHRFLREISSSDRKALISKLYFLSFDLGTMPSNDGD